MARDLEVDQLPSALQTVAKPAAVPILHSFFKTGPGQYGEGDQFIGVKVPQLRVISKLGDRLPLDSVKKLLRSAIHEERLLALMILVRQFQRGDLLEQEAIVQCYLQHTNFINNWDLVDSSAPYLLGAWLLTRDRSILDQLARSTLLWERRIAIVATQTFIRARDLEWTFRLGQMLLNDPHDLMHKAVGWMLREAGKRDADALRRFLDEHTTHMPRTMLRYAIERFSPEERARYLQLPRASRNEVASYEKLAALGGSR